MKFSKANLSVYNLDDYIRQERVNGKKTLTWSGERLKLLRDFVRAYTKSELPINFPNGHTFLKIKHYAKN
jgi:hypothetical protein